MIDTETTLCRLCKESADLRVSHIIPSFVFKWLKDSSATGHIRFVQEPNKRIQDGFKKPMLCADCEALISNWEGSFASSIFLPYVNDRSLTLKYEDWMLKLCVSISWRVLVWMMEEDVLEHFSAAQFEKASAALDRWRKFMLGQVPHPGPFQQHILPLDSIRNSGGMAMPANIHRYLLRTVDIDAVVGESAGFVYSKFGPFALVGFTYVDAPNIWRETKVHVRHGEIKPRDYELPSEFFRYILDRTQLYANANAQISEKQREKISASAWSDVERVKKSGSFEALRQDVENSGQEAFDIHVTRERKRDE